MGCTISMIGPSTAITAAHCVWSRAANNPIANHIIHFGASLSQSDGGTFNRVLYVGGGLPADLYQSLAVPTQYKDVIPNNYDYLNYDFAIMEFYPKQGTPGAVTGWLGTFWGTNGTRYLVGYPEDKVHYTMWESDAGVTMANQLPRVDNYAHWIDIKGGNSGGCLRAWTSGGTSNPSYGYYMCTAIQSTEGSNTIPNVPYHNEARAWDAFTYNFADTRANWP